MHSAITSLISLGIIAPTPVSKAANDIRFSKLRLIFLENRVKNETINPLKAYASGKKVA